MNNNHTRQWAAYLSDDDIGFIKRFVLSSGSLKEMASQYSVSYPTVRRRLDRVIAKISAIESTIDQTDFERVLTLFSADGRIDAHVRKTLLDAYHKEQNQ